MGIVRAADVESLLLPTRSASSEVGDDAFQAKAGKVVDHVTDGS